MLFPLILCFYSFFTIPAIIEKAKIKLALAIYTGAPIVAKEAIDIPSLVADKKIKVLSK